MTHTSTIFLVLRRLRTPLLVLITLFAISVLGLTLMPGPLDPNGSQLPRMSFFHAVYFISYTATTIGFGEIPYAFSEQQRLWTVVCIYMSVVGWAYTLGSVFAMLQDKNFLNALAVQRFARQVRRLREHFFLVCGYGEAGHLICQALDELGYRAVVIEKDEVKIGDLELQSYQADVPALCADAGQPDTLIFAGLTSKYCRGVMALTNDDSTNLAVAIAARLLAPALPALCRAEHADTVANMASFGTRHIINPFEKFAEYMALALHSPAAYNLLLWLTGLPGTIIDRAAPLAPDHTWYKGDGTGADALAAAGISDAVGIVAATASDVNNLSTVVTAKQLNPALFTVLRQNHVANRTLFDAFESDFAMVPAEIVAHECLAILTTPLLTPFLDRVRSADDAWAGTLLEELTGRFGWDVPCVWSVSINLLQSPAVYRVMMRHEARLSLSALLRAPVTDRPPLACTPLLLLREGDPPRYLPDGELEIRLGDQLLFAGTEEARRDLGMTLFNGHTLQFVLTGRDLPGGLIWEWLAQRREARSRSS